MRVTRPLFPIVIKWPWGKYCSDDSDFIFGRMFIKLRDNKGRHKISDKLNFSPVAIIDIRVTCP